MSDRKELNDEKMVLKENKTKLSSGKINQLEEMKDNKSTFKSKKSQDTILTDKYQMSANENEQGTAKGFKTITNLLKSIKSNDSSEKDKLSQPIFSLMKSNEKKMELEKSKKDTMNKMMRNFQEVKNDLDMFDDKVVPEDNEKFKKDSENVSRGGLQLIIPDHQFRLKTIKDRVFWTKEQLRNIRNKIRLAKRSIEQKTEDDFRSLKELIDSDSTEEVIKVLFNKHFQAFYSLEFPKRKILQYILLNNKPEMLSEILGRNHYIWKGKFIFKHISEKIDTSDKTILKNQEELAILTKNVVEYDLYDKKLAKLLAWLIGSYGFYDTFRLLVFKHDEFNEELEQYRNFEDNYEIEKWIEEIRNFNETVISCLKNKFDKLAIALVTFRNYLDDNEIIECAIELENIGFLKFIWEKQSSSLQAKNINRNTIKKKTSNVKVDSRRKTMFDFKFTNATNSNFNNGELLFTVSELVTKFAQMKHYKKNHVHEIISNWKLIEYDPEILKTLFENEYFDDFATLIRRFPDQWKFNTDHLKTAIYKGQLDLILFFLTKRECRAILNEESIQKVIVRDYMEGNRMYYCAEMLGYITKTNWKTTLTGQLIKNVKKTIKTKSVLECHSPLLTCMLLCEFITLVGEGSINFKILSQRTVTQLCKFCQSIQEANPDEKYIKFLMTQKDTKSRSTFQIAADNNYIIVLKTPEVGTIVQKMWNGRLSHESYFAFSSLSKYLDPVSSRSLNPYHNFESMNKNKTYFHQLHLWMESSSLRYWPESISNIMLILLYNLFIYFLVTDTKQDQEVKTMMKPISELETRLKMMAYIYIIWVGCIVLNILLLFIFCRMSNRKFKMDTWGYIEILNLVSACCMLLDTNMIFPNKNENGETIPSNGHTDNAFILRAVILSINDVFVWLRITGILLTFKNLGPLIRMIYLLSIVIAKYLVIYGLYLTCCAAIFTAIFYSSSEQFALFSKTFAVLFAGFLNQFDVFNFDQNKTLGAVLTLVYVTFSFLLLGNLLIAMISNVYLTLSSEVDASHRMVLINYYRRYKWDRKYGYLLFLTTPSNIFNFITILISFFFSDKEKFNRVVCRIYYCLTYLPAIIIPQLFMSLVFIPFCYFKGLIHMAYYQYYSKTTIISKLGNWLNWLVFGIFFLILMLVRDIYLVATTTFNKIVITSYEKNRIQTYFPPEDIRIFLQYIHSKSESDPCDLKSLFMDYIQYDEKEKAEHDQSLKKQKDYLKLIQTAGKSDTKKSYKSNNSIFLFKTQHKRNKQDVNQPVQESAIMNDFLKRNLVVIEIFENFLIDDGSDNFIVDIRKLKMLLPKTMNINNHYIKRIINTDINSISKAINKLKNRKKTFQQNVYLNKIVGSVVRLDGIVDSMSSDPLSLEQDKKLYRYDVDENEDKFYANLIHLLDEISKSVKMSVKDLHIKIKKNENKTINNTSNIENNTDDKGSKVDVEKQDFTMEGDADNSPLSKRDEKQN